LLEKVKKEEGAQKELELSAFEYSLVCIEMIGGK
jgi:hypothetical protein